jgi:hypothetical protein
MGRHQYEAPNLFIKGCLNSTVSISQAVLEYFDQDTSNMLMVR